MAVRHLAPPGIQWIQSRSNGLHCHHPMECDPGKNKTLAAAGVCRLSRGCLLRPLPVSSQALSQSHPSGIQPHTQLQLPEWLSRPAASLLTEVRSAGPAEAAPWPEGGRWEGRTLCVNKHAATGWLTWVQEVTKFSICWWPNTTSVFPRVELGVLWAGLAGSEPPGPG